MSKNMRFVIVLVVLAVIVVLAGSRTAWASKAILGQEPAPAAGNVESGQAASPKIGTVSAQNCEDTVRVLTGETKSLCAIATITGVGDADLFATLSPLESPFATKIINIIFYRGSAQICYAAPEGGVIYFNAVNSADWVPLTTGIDNGIACALISESGNYAFGLK